MWDKWVPLLRDKRLQLHFSVDKRQKMKIYFCFSEKKFSTCPVKDPSVETMRVFLSTYYGCIGIKGPSIKPRTTRARCQSWIPVTVIALVIGSWLLNVVLTHWGHSKMADILQTTYSNAVSSKTQASLKSVLNCAIDKKLVLFRWWLGTSVMIFQFRDAYMRQQTSEC